MKSKVKSFWTADRINGAIKSTRRDGVVSFDVTRDSVSDLKVLNEFLFTKRPDLQLSLSPKVISTEGTAYKGYSANFLLVLSQMKYLRRLKISFDAKQDLSVLSGLKSLEALVLKTKVSMDVGFLAGLFRLKTLHLYGKYDDLKGLTYCKSLENLFVYRVKEIDFSFATGLSLKCVLLSQIGEKTNFKFLCKPCLRVLSIDSIENLEDLSFLSVCSGLEKLQIIQSKVKQLPNLIRLAKLKELYLQGMRSMEDIRNLSSAKNLELVCFDELGNGVKGADLINTILEMKRLKAIYGDYLDAGGRRKQIVVDRLHKVGKGEIVKEGLIVLKYDL